MSVLDCRLLSAQLLFAVGVREYLGLDVSYRTSQINSLSLYLCDILRIRLITPINQIVWHQIGIFSGLWHCLKRMLEVLS